MLPSLTCRSGSCVGGAFESNSTTASGKSLFAIPEICTPSDANCSPRIVPGGSVEKSSTKPCVGQGPGAPVDVCVGVAAPPPGIAVGVGVGVGDTPGPGWQLTSIPVS